MGGSTELLVILVVALIVLGPKSLAKVSRTLGKAMGEFRRVSTDFQRTLNAEAAEDERRERREAVAKAARQAKERSGSTGNDKESEMAAEPPVSENADASAQAPNTQPTAEEQPVTPPPGSPLEAALARTHAQAQAAQAQIPSPSALPDNGDKA